MNLRATLETAKEPDLVDWLGERNRALETLDMDYARRMMPNATSDDVRLLAMHKARYECTAVSDESRRDSEKWLKAGGYTRLMGLPWPKKKLPR